MMYKVIGSVIYTIINNYICIGYMIMMQDNLSNHDNNFKNTKLNNVSGLGIPDVLMNIMSCHGFLQPSISKVILTCGSALVPYYPSKGFVIVETKEGVKYNIKMSVKDKINADNLHPKDSLLTCK